MRIEPFAGMKQPTPDGGILGIDTIMLIQKDGLPQNNIMWRLFDGPKLIQSGYTDRFGLSSGLLIKRYECGCTPKYSRHGQLCDLVLPCYYIDIDDCHNFDESASRELSLWSDDGGTVFDPVI